LPQAPSTLPLGRHSPAYASTYGAGCNGEGGWGAKRGAALVPREYPCLLVCLRTSREMIFLWRDLEAIFWSRSDRPLPFHNSTTLVQARTHVGAAGDGSPTSVGLTHTLTTQRAVAACRMPRGTAETTPAPRWCAPAPGPGLSPKRKRYLLLLSCFCRAKSKRRVLGLRS
jgi:hypothetical protein